MEQSTIYVIAHKKVEYIIKKHYKVISVSRDFDSQANLSDNTLLNIADKNKYFSELTAMYWIHKNIANKNIGIMHYRRYLTKELNIFKPKPVSIKYIDKLLNKYDCILPRKVKLRQNKELISVYTHYEKSHNINDLIITRNIISEIYPEYLESFDYVMNNTFMHMFNIIVGSKDFYDKYCSWLFTILFRLESVIDISNYDDYQKRVFGFIAERLLNVYIYKNKCRIKELPYIETNKNIFIQNLKNNIKYLLRR